MWDVEEWGDVAHDQRVGIQIHDARELVQLPQTQLGVLQDNEASDNS
jgi:hypothetical protein